MDFCLCPKATATQKSFLMVSHETEIHLKFTSIKSGKVIFYFKNTCTLSILVWQSGSSTLQVFVLLITFMLVLFKFAMVLAYSRPDYGVNTQQPEIYTFVNKTTPLPFAWYTDVQSTKIFYGFVLIQLRDWRVSIYSPLVKRNYQWLVIADYTGSVQISETHFHLFASL